MPMRELVARIRALRAERAQLVVEQERRLASAAAANRALTDEERAADDAGHARIEAIDDELGRYERQERAAAVVAMAAEDARLRGVDRVDPAGGFASLSEFARAVARSTITREVDPRLAAALPSSGVHREVGSDDGYMVPAEFRRDIVEVVFAEEGLLATVAPEPTTANAVSYLRDETTPWGSSGILAYWAGETPSMGSFASKLATQSSLIQLHKLFAFTAASDDLLEDAPRLQDRLTRKAGEAIRWKAEEAIVNGTGQAQPLGWMQSNALVTVTKETSQAAATINAANVVKMFSRLLPSGVSDAIWLINSDAFPQLPLMTVGNVPIFLPPATGIASAPGGFLLGRPVRFSEHCQTLGTKGDIQLISPRGYYAVTKPGGIAMASSVHLYFDQDAQAFRWTFRLGGQPYLSAPVTPARGSATKSHFVCVETRS